MLVLGIESSCDETAAAVVADGERILSSVVASQVLTHEKYGGVVPELASREHLKKIGPVVDEALRRAAVTMSDVDAVAVTEGPGLIGSLLVGLVYGKALALSLGKPIVGVNHLEGHIHAVLLENKIARQAGQAIEEARLPSVALVVSGGHTSLFHVAVRPSDGASAPVFSYKLLGHTRDDAAGEAFDKVAKLLALGYPGGPVIDRLAKLGKPAAVDFGRIKMKGNPFDFSFAGLKTAVLYRVRGTPLAVEAEQRRAWRAAATGATVEEIRGHCSQETLDLLASFEHAVVTDLVERTLAAAQKCCVQSVFVSGGVACNTLLRGRFAEAVGASRLPFGKLTALTPRLRSGSLSGVEGSNVEGRRPSPLRQAFFPSPELCTDNAAMIAAAGYFKLQAGHRADLTLTARASFPLGTAQDGA